MGDFQVSPLTCRSRTVSAVVSARSGRFSWSSEASTKPEKKRAWSAVVTLGKKAVKKLFGRGTKKVAEQRVFSSWNLSRIRLTSKSKDLSQSSPEEEQCSLYTDRLRSGESEVRSIEREAISSDPATEASQSETATLSSSISSFTLQTPSSNSTSPTHQTTPYARVALSKGLSRIRYQTFAMEQPRVSRFLDPSSAVAAITKHKAEAIRLAREQGAAVREMCRRAKTEPPPYEFEELIGKGAYGRVYKGHQLPSRQVVALKVLDIDSLDYKSVRDFRDESIKDFIHEAKATRSLSPSGYLSPSASLGVFRFNCLPICIRSRRFAFGGFPVAISNSVHPYAQTSI